MSPLRTCWVDWCVMWALGWLLIGFFTFLGPLDKGTEVYMNRRTQRART